jgi:BolA family transcriptional regulator, general stress-responsive regulator
VVSLLHKEFLLNLYMYYEIIKAKLEEALSPLSIIVEDESYKHKGHIGAEGRNETHFYIEIVSNKFNDLNKLQRHRLVNEILNKELKEHVHAISLKLLSEKEI